jgi:hypothetical protein
MPMKEVKPMDKLAKQLRDDAERINVAVSDELDHRIEASLRAVTPEVEGRPVPVSRPPLFWWASTITGVAAALAVIAIVNWQTPQQADVPPVQVADLAPPIDLKLEAAMLTAPLEEELEALQSDLKKAEEKVRRDIGL